MRSFAQALEATGYPERFMIEVTEDAFVAKTHFQDEILPIFRKLGVGISIDDFGIGYSSLSALADITADEIKIDRSFITDIHKRPRSQGILRAIESLSEALGMTVIAEGIETFEELAYLQAATKIRYAQGYYFSRPIFLEELKPAIPIASEARASPASRPRAGNPPGLSRAALARSSPAEASCEPSPLTVVDGELAFTPCLLRQHRQRRHAVVRRARLHGDQRHRDQIVIADDADDIHDAALAEFVERGLVDGIGDLLVAIERGGKIIQRGLVVLHVVGPLAGRDVADDLRIEAAFERQRIMREPFILRGPLPGGDQDRQFAQARRQRGIPAQIFRQRRQLRRQIGIADIGAIGRAANLALRGGAAIMSAQAFCGGVSSSAFSGAKRVMSSARLTPAASRSRPPGRRRRADFSWLLSLMIADFRRVGLVGR